MSFSGESFAKGSTLQNHTDRDQLRSLCTTVWHWVSHHIRCQGCIAQVLPSAKQYKNALKGCQKCRESCQREGVLWQHLPRVSNMPKAICTRSESGPSPSLQDW